MKFSVYLFFLCLFLASCGQNKAKDQEANSDTSPDTIPQAPENIAASDPAPDVLDFVKPIVLLSASTDLILKDYFRDVSKIDSIVCSSQIRATLSEDKERANISIIGDIGYYEPISFYLGTSHYDFLLLAPNTVSVTLRFRDSGNKSVAVKGEMNSWDPSSGKMILRNGVWEATFNLQPGKYEYRFVVDGEEVLDPKNPRKVADGSGGENSQLNLKQPNQANLPTIKVVNSETGQVRIAGENIGHIFAFWNNQLLNTEKSDGIFVLNIPSVAQTVDESFIRIFSQNEFGPGLEVLLTLQNGKVVE